jgi:hypothetical protein
MRNKIFQSQIIANRLRLQLSRYRTFSPDAQPSPIGSDRVPWICQCYITEPPQEFDEPGQELARDAQVWKTYVKEADAMDAEHVEGWKQ